MADMNDEVDAVTHSKALMLGLNELRKADKLLDVTLLVEGSSFKAHRVVLAACSDYFAAMFTDPMKEAQQSEIKLIDIPVRGMHSLLEYAYTSKLDLNRNNIQDILAAATHVQMNAVVHSCSTYLESQIDMENCVDIATLADLYSLNNLKHKTYRFICAHLWEFAKTPDMDNLSCEQLEYILSCDYPVDCSEELVLHIVAEYCVKKIVSLENATKLFTKIRFDQINTIDFKIWPVFPSVDEDKHLPYFNVMRAAGFQQKKSCKKKYSNCDLLRSNILTNTRGMELALVKIGGFYINGVHNQLSFALPNERKWHQLTCIPHIEQCNYGTAVLGNDLFVVGGSYDVCLKEYIHGFGFRYSAAKDKWSTISPIQSERCRFSLNAVGNFLYAVGGVCDQIEGADDTWLEGRRESNCEKYNVEANTWEYIKPLRENRSQHAGAVQNHFLYISGGIDRHLVLSSFWRYDTHSDNWQQMSPMPKPRADHVMLAIDDKIYACGGWFEDPNTGTRVLIDDIDVYDVGTDSWYLETKNPVPTFHAGISAVRNKIYFVGGLLSDETINCSSNVQTYDLLAKEWSTLTEWEGAKPTWECTCATFYVPRCREGI
ncbi:kelch-like protein 26 [Eupeodes corollae]|uniref:kelch-like protein 26 n=1 Tax=Eupeodes corollae TaxID=290404 RepID=UPI002490AFEE|nr:kelch-like protein 26 [Eupeodes corollae]